MKCLVVSDSFKGTLSSNEIGSIIKEELNKKNILCDYYPVSDGGEGFIEAISYILKIDSNKISCIDALNKESMARYVYDKSDNTLYVEMAEVCGLQKLKGIKSAYNASSYGLGKFIVDAIKICNPKRVVVGLGGTASVDLGFGFLEGMGAKFYDKDNNIIKFLSNNKLPLVKRIDSSELKKYNNIDFIIVNDVKITIFGPEGTILKYGKQKCNDNENILTLENNAKSVFPLIKDLTKIDDYLGGGAAGGVAYAINAFFKSSEISGTELIFDKIRLNELVKKYDYIITGEGHFDSQTFQGKVVNGVLKATKNYIIICGGMESNFNLKNVYPIVPNVASLEESIKNPKKCLKKLINSINWEEYNG